MVPTWNKHLRLKISFFLENYLTENIFSNFDWNERNEKTKKSTLYLDLEITFGLINDNADILKVHLPTSNTVLETLTETENTGLKTK